MRKRKHNFTIIWNNIFETFIASGSKSADTNIYHSTLFPGFSPTRPLSLSLSLSHSVGQVGENPGNEVDIPLSLKFGCRK